MLLSSERRLSKEGELTPRKGELTETDGLPGLLPEPVGRLLREGGVLRDVTVALDWVSSLRGRAYRGTGCSVAPLLCAGSNLRMSSARDNDGASSFGG